MPIEKIIERIEKETQRKIDNIIQRGKEKSEKVKQEIDKEKERRHDEIKKEKEREIKTMENRIISQAKLEAKKEKLNVREEIINDVFEDAKAKLEEKEPEEYKGYLEQCLKRSDKILGEDITVKCDPESEEMVNELAQQINSGIKIEPSLDTIGGIKALSEKGSRIDFTFEANLERKRKELRKEISDILFQEED